VFRLRNAKLEILWTLDLYGKDRLDEVNTSSIVSRLELEGQSFLMLGDMSFSARKRIMQIYTDALKSDFVQVAHHGADAPAAALPQLLGEQPRHRYYDTEQLCALFRACAGDPLEAPIKLAGYLGLRRSEICGLKWRSVDLDACVIRICEVRTAVGGLAIEKPPKTDSSLRRLGYGGVDDLEELLVRLHRDWEWARHERSSFNPEGYVAVTAEGRPWSPDALGSHVAAFIAAHDLPPISLHGLRHSFASVANSRSVPMFTISKALGHSSTSITSAVYTHLFDETVQDVVSVVADAIVRCGQSSVSMS